MADRLLETPFGSLRLDRYPPAGNDPLRAWDAADEYVLAHLHELGVLEAALDPTADPEIPPVRIAVLNDAFGALGAALAPTRPSWHFDSELARRALVVNLEQNVLDGSLLRIRSDLEAPDEPLDVLVVKIPRSNALLAHQLFTMRSALRPGTVVVGAAMTKHVHNSTISIFEQLIGPTRTSLAKKKARLLFSTLDEALDPGPEPKPSSYEIESMTLAALPGVFSSDHLDKGTRLLIDQLPELTDGASSIVDLACGNGVIGLCAGRNQPEAELVFTDESCRAIESTRRNLEAVFPDRVARCLVTDGLHSVDDGSVDLVLTNPPFHQGNAQTDAIAWRLFTDAYRALEPGGRLVVVGNRHLAHHAKLAKLFSNRDIVASNPGYVVLMATR